MRSSVKYSIVLPASTPSNALGRTEIKRLRRLVRLHKMSDETVALRIEVIDASIAQAFTRQGCQRADKDYKNVVKKGVKKERRGLKMVAATRSEDGGPMLLGGL